MRPPVVGGCVATLSFYLLQLMLKSFWGFFKLQGTRVGTLRNAVGFNRWFYCSAEEPVSAFLDALRTPMSL